MSDTHSLSDHETVDRQLIHAGLVRSFNNHYFFGRSAANMALLGAGLVLGGPKGMFAAAAIELVNHALRSDGAMSKTMNAARESFIDRHWQSLARSGFAQTVKQALHPNARLPHFSPSALPRESRLDFSLTAFSTGLKLSSLGAAYNFGKWLLSPPSQIGGPR